MGQYLRIWVLKVNEHFTGYVNPLLAYGENRAIQDAAEAGANGFVMVDLPPEEAISFREKCRRAKCVLIFLQTCSSLILSALTVYLMFP